MKVAIFYGRFSSEDQSKGTSKERQLEGFQNFLKVSGLQAAKRVYFDDGVSGFTGEQMEAEFGQMLKDIQDAKYDAGSVVWCEHMNRFSRMDMLDTLIHIRTIHRAGLGFNPQNHCKTYWNETPPMERMGMVFDSTSNNMFSANLQRVLKDANKRKRTNRDGINVGMRKRGLKTEAIPCWLVLAEDKKGIDGTGYTWSVEDRKVIPKSMRDDPLTIQPRALRHAMNLKEACLLSIAGFGVKEIVKEMAKKGKTINPNGLVNLFKSRALIGEYQPMIRINKKTRKAEGFPIKLYPALLEVNQFNELQKGLKRRAGVRNNPRKTNVISNLFTGIIFNQDGEVLAIKPMGGNRPDYLAVRHFLKFDEKTGKGIGGYWANGKSIRYQLVEDALLKAFLRIKKSELYPTNTTAEQREISEISARIEDNEATVKKYLSSGKKLSPGQFEYIGNLESENEVLKEQRAELQDKLDSSKANHLGTAQGLITGLPEASENLYDYRTRLKDVIRTMVKRITITEILYTEKNQFVSADFKVEFVNGLVKTGTATKDDAFAHTPIPKLLSIGLEWERVRN